MKIPIDILIIAILILNVVNGYKKGLINVIFNICAFLIAIVITLILYKPVANIIIKNTDIDENIKTMIINNNMINENNEEENKKSSGNKIQDYVESKVNDATETAKEKAIEVVANNIAINIVEILTGIILFAITRIIVILLKFITDTLANLPLVKQCNEIGGIIYGLIKGLIIIYLLLTVMFFVVSINGNGIISNEIDNSIIAKFLYNNNIIVNYCLLGKNLL